MYSTVYINAQQRIRLTAMIIHLANFLFISPKIIQIFWRFIEKQIFKYDDIGIVSRVSVNGRLFVVPKEELDGLVSILSV